MSIKAGTLDDTSGLSPREHEILGLLAEGHTQGQIATELVISSKTVATHIQHILSKLGVNTRAQAVALAFRNQPWTRSFGTPTGGMTTSNRLIELPDGARIALTTQWMADRRGVRATGALQPDARIDDPDAVVDAAFEWLEREHGCRG